MPAVSRSPAYTNTHTHKYIYINNSYDTTTKTTTSYLLQQELRQAIRNGIKLEEQHSGRVSVATVKCLSRRDV
jgi:hypothetical protein